MTTPDPITTAREALEELLLTATQKAADRDACENAVSKYQAVRSIFDHVEKLKAERDKALTQIGLLGVQIETIRGLKATEALNEITRLTSQLEQAERVIKPFAEFVDCLDEELPDDEEYNTELGLEGYHSLTCGNFRDASQWIKDRQATTDAIGDK